MIISHRTTIRKGFSSVKEFIEEPESRAQCMALEENVRDFGLTYFGMKDRRQGVCIFQLSSPFPDFSTGIVHIIGPEQGFTVSWKCALSGKFLTIHR